MTQLAHLKVKCYFQFKETNTVNLLIVTEIFSYFHVKAVTLTFLYLLAYFQPETIQLASLL